jgi:hypothetical protein
MKRLSTSAAASAVIMASLMFLTACQSGTEVEGDAAASAILVHVTDSLSGQPLEADTVYWSFHNDNYSVAKAAHGIDTSYKAATRVDSTGTRWMIEDDRLHGAVYIRARHQENGAFCFSQGYKVLAFNADSLPQEVTIALKVNTICL